MSSLFADDMTYQHHNSELEVLEKEANEELQREANWLQQTNYIRKKRGSSYFQITKNSHITMKLNGVEIQKNRYSIMKLRGSCMLTIRPEFTKG